jgi:hypothetical protein
MKEKSKYYNLQWSSSFIFISLIYLGSSRTRNKLEYIFGISVEYISVGKLVGGMDISTPIKGLSKLEYIFSI